MVYIAAQEIRLNYEAALKRKGSKNFVHKWDFLNTEIVDFNSMQTSLENSVGTEQNILDRIKFLL